MNDLLVYIQQIGELQNSIKWAAHPQLKFELGILKMAKLPSSVDIETILEKLELLKKKDPLTESPPQIENAIPELNIANLNDTWSDLISEFKEYKVHLANALDLGKIHNFTGGYSSGVFTL